MSIPEFGRLTKSPLIKMNSIHENGIKMACEWICRRFYDEPFSKISSEHLDFNYLFDKKPNISLANKFNKSPNFLNLFNADRMYSNSIPEKCLKFFNTKHIYNTKDTIIYPYTIVERFWK